MPLHVSLNQHYQLGRNEVIAALQTVTLTQPALERLFHLGQASISTHPATKKTSLKKLPAFISIDYAEGSGSFVDVTLIQKSLTQTSEPVDTHNADDDDLDFVMIDEAPPITLEDSEITFLSETMTLTLPGLGTTAFMPGALLIADAKERLLALPAPLLQNDFTLLNEDEKNVIHTLNKWHETHRTNNAVNIALAAIAYCHDPEHNRLIIRHTPYDATSAENEALANQHINNITKEIIKRLALQRAGLQIHHIMPWIQAGWSSDHITLKIKTECFAQSYLCEEHNFDPRKNFSALLGNQLQHTMNVQSLWNRNDCGRYVTVSTIVAAFILNNRGSDKRTLTDADLTPYLRFIKSAENHINAAALRTLLLEFESFSPPHSSPTQSTASTMTSSPASSNESLDMLGNFVYTLFKGAKTAMGVTEEGANSPQQRR